MRPRILAVLAMLSATIALGDTLGTFTDEIDRFTGDRTVKWSNIPAAPKDFALSTIAAFNPDGTEQGYITYLTTYADESRFSDCNKVHWLFDGQRAPNVVNDYRASHSKHGVMEHFRVFADRDLLKRFAGASRVEFKVCNVESEVSQEDLDGLRLVLKSTE